MTAATLEAWIDGVQSTDFSQVFGLMRKDRLKLLL